jgi:starvation-inducible DNA-binding protein
MKSFLELTHLTEDYSEMNNSQGSVQELLSDHESICIILRSLVKPFADDFHDAGSSDLMVRVLGIHENIAWQLRSHIDVPVERSNHTQINKP